MNLFNRYKISLDLNGLVAIITALLILILLLTSSLVLWPKFKETGRAGRSTLQKEEEIKSSQNYFTALKDAKSELDQYENELSKIGSALPESPSVPDFFNFLQQAVSQSGMSLQRSGDFTTSLSSRFPGLQETIFPLQVAGSYESFKTFLSTLEKSARIIEVQTFSLAPGAGSTSDKKTKGFFVFDLNVKTYSY